MSVPMKQIDQHNARYEVECECISGYEWAYYYSQHLIVYFSDDRYWIADRVEIHECDSRIKTIEDLAAEIRAVFHVRPMKWTSADEVRKRLAEKKPPSFSGGQVTPTETGQSVFTVSGGLPSLGRRK